jgi:hypothetical protein
MTMIPITGGAYKHPSQDVNCQRCVNMFPTEIGPNGLGIDDPNNAYSMEGISKGTLIRSPGTKMILDLGGQQMRCIYRINDELGYTVIDNKLYSLTINQVARTVVSAVVGTLSTSVGPVHMSNNATQLIIVDGSPNGYVYTASTGAFKVLTTADNFNGGVRVVYNDGYFLYDQPGTNTVWQSAINDGTSYNALAFFTAQTKPCILNGLAVNKGEVWLFGDVLTEVWYDAANAPPGSAYSYRVGSGMDIGCVAPHSIVEMELINIWLDSRGFVVVSDISPYIRNNNSGYDLRVVSTPALHAEWATYATLADAIGTYFVDRGHIMYMISFPSAQKTWVYDFPARPTRMTVTPGEWHERTYLNPSTYEEEYYLIQYTATFGQLTLGGGTRSGKIYDFSHMYFTDDGAPIRCTRTTAPFTSDFKYVGVDKLSLRMESGDALQAGDGSNPAIMLRYSNDGAHTWSYFLDPIIGKVGQYNKKITWNRLGTAEEWVFEFTIQSPINFSLIKASAEVSTIEDGF